MLVEEHPRGRCPIPPEFRPKLLPVKPANITQMEHPLSITSVIGTDDQGHQLRSRVNIVTAETNLGPSPQLGFPESFYGQLVGIATESLEALKFGKGVEVAFEGKVYRFVRLEDDGTFELRKK